MSKNSLKLYSAREIKSCINDGDVVLFLIRNKRSQESRVGDQDFDFYFHFNADSELDSSGPIVIGLLNGVFGSLDDTLDLAEFRSSQVLNDVLSTQLATYILQELIYFSSNDISHLTNMILSLKDYLLKIYHREAEQGMNKVWGITPRQIGRIQKYVNDNIHNRISIDSLAELTGLSVFHFSRMFKKTTNETPYQFIKRKKMEEAKVLLEQSSESVIQVAMKVGFDNPSHFAHSFKLVNGVTPLKYRQVLKYQLVNF